MEFEYRVIWQREGQQKKRRIFQTREGALREASRQETAREDMDWIEPRLAPIIFGPVIQLRDVGPWSEEVA